LKSCFKNNTGTPFSATLKIDAGHVNTTVTLGPVNFESSFDGYYGLLVSVCLLGVVLVSIAAVLIYCWWKNGAKIPKFWKRASTANVPPASNPPNGNQPSQTNQVPITPKRRAPPPPPVLPFWPQNDQSCNNHQNDASDIDIEAANTQDESFNTENTYESLDQPEPIPQENPYLIDFSCYGVPSNLNNV